MACLIYCIMEAGQMDGPRPPRGVGGRPVFLVGANGLSAAWSQLTSPEPPADVSCFLKFEQIVESFHQNWTVIPMRYGCLAEDENRIIGLLGEHDQHYRALIEELKGCVEMGVRILLPDQDDDATRPDQREPDSDQPPFSSPTDQPSGRDYLSARRSRYEGQERINERKQEVIQRCRLELAGLFQKCKVDKSSSAISPPLFGRHQAALHFLISREAVEPFRNAFRMIPPVRSAKLLLSGPWPPYNFVIPQDRQLPDWGGKWSGNGP